MHKSARRTITTALALGATLALLLPVPAQDSAHKGHGAAEAPAAKGQPAEPKTGHMQKMHAKHKKHMESHAAAPPKGDVGPASQAYRAINAQMHERMDITFTGDADTDFLAGMIPHHQAAIDMAKVVLAFGKDPEVRKLAESIIKEQEAEIATMTAALKARGK